jgi:hypothetical protein
MAKRVDASLEMTHETLCRVSWIFLMLRLACSKRLLLGPIMGQVSRNGLKEILASI